MPGTLRATSEGRSRRAVARTAAVLAAVASVALAGCAVPGAPEKTVAGPPASVPPTGRTAPDPAEPTPPGTSAHPRTPGRTPTPPPRDPAPASSPPPGLPTVSPTTKLPDLSRTPPPSPSPRPRTTPAKPSTKPSAGAGAERFGRRGPDGSTTLRIGSWSARVVRGGQEAVDECRDAVQWTGPDLGTEDGYALRTAVVVGHDYCGFERFAKLPVGTVVTATTPRGTFEYRVYAHYVSPGRGTPSQGLYWGDLTLQSCVGPNTGFSYLMRV
ncbi:hypothetical protein [Streptomyces olivochromogenes]|uniref:hypothetical protein n=1 Tax=Streptomyces olivochromogenes TaxID=1963 RepID=UPI0036CEF1F8